MRLQRNEDGFSGSDTSGACEAVGQGYLRGSRILSLNLVFCRYFVWILRNKQSVCTPKCYMARLMAMNLTYVRFLWLLRRKRLYWFDTRDTG
jgi:hypothetical protein